MVEILLPLVALGFLCYMIGYARGQDREYETQRKLTAALTKDLRQALKRKHFSYEADWWKRGDESPY